MYRRDDRHIHRYRRMRADGQYFIYIHHHRYHPACISPVALTVTAECTGSDPSLNAAYQTWRYSFGGVSATDLCGTATMTYRKVLGLLPHVLT